MDLSALLLFPLQLKLLEVVIKLVLDSIFQFTHALHLFLHFLLHRNHTPGHLRLEVIKTSHITSALHCRGTLRCGFTELLWRRGTRRHYEDTSWSFLHLRGFLLLWFFRCRLIHELEDGELLHFVSLSILFVTMSMPSPFHSQDDRNGLHIFAIIVFIFLYLDVT